MRRRWGPRTICSSGWRSSGEGSRTPTKLRKLIARTFLQAGQPSLARVALKSIMARGRDPEAAWLLSRAYLQEGDKAQASAALAEAGSYRADNPLEAEPGPYVGEARCEKCHSAPSRARAQEFQGEEIGLRDGLARCLYCHLTNPRAGREPIGPETADRAIGCERCHGPGGNHLASIQAGFRDSAIVNPGAASPAAVTTKQCNDCHILDRNFPNGDPDNPGWVRSQGVGWTLSRCNTESDGAFGCVTCHDPHKSARATTTAQYEVKCLACHGRAVQPEHNAKAGSTPLPRAEVRARICPVDSSKGCIPCHMPRVRIDPLHLDLTDHYIRVDRRKR